MNTAEFGSLDAVMSSISKPLQMDSSEPTMKTLNQKMDFKMEKLDALDKNFAAFNKT